MSKVIILFLLLADIPAPPVNLVKMMKRPKELEPAHLVEPALSKRFCDGRVYPPNGMPHLTWIAYATDEKPEVIRERYLRRLGKKNHERTEHGDLWRVPKKKPMKVLAVYPATYAGPWATDCKLPLGSRTVVEISTFPRGKR